MTEHSQISGARVIGLALANAILVAAALLTSDPRHYGAIAVGTGMFITVVFVLCHRCAKS